MTCRDWQYLNIKSRDTFSNPLSLTNRVKNVDVLYACAHTGNNQPTCVPRLARNTGVVRLGPWDLKSFVFFYGNNTYKVGNRNDMYFAASQEAVTCIRTTTAKANK